MERLTHYRSTWDNKGEFAEPEDGVDDGDIYNYLPELLDKLEDVTEIEITRLDMPTWNYIQELAEYALDGEVEIQSNYFKVYISEDKNCILGDIGNLTYRGDYSKQTYENICKAVGEHREALIKELRGEK